MFIILVIKQWLHGRYLKQVDNSEPQRIENLSNSREYWKYFNTKHLILFPVFERVKSKETKLSKRLANSISFLLVLFYSLLTVFVMKMVYDFVLLVDL